MNRNPVSKQQLFDWQSEVEISYFNQIQTLPLIHKGSNPYKDVEVVNRMRERRIVWFYYDIEDYVADYWSLLLLHYTFNKDFDVQLTTALQLSENLGIPVQERNIPPLWIMSVERSAQIKP